MEMIMDCFFDNVFSELDRASLLARYKRRNLVEYLSTVIQACSHVEGHPQEACKSAIVSALNFHKTTRGQNGEVCLMGKYHNVLYVAARLAFDWKLEDAETVCWLLDDMFLCERTFDRLITGAIFGSRASGVIAGWKSDFDTREECLEAVEYFLRHATTGKKEYLVRKKSCRIVDVPMESYGRFTPATVAVQAIRPDVLLLLLQFGAEVYAEDDPCPLEALLRRLSECQEQVPPDLLTCRDVIMRTVAHVSVPHDAEHPYVAAYVSGMRLIPEDRTTSPATLKHLCRITIRKSMNQNCNLPFGIKELGIPDNLESFLNLEVD
uniref:Ankyrin repeat and SOCS box protein 17 n=1 Tax=Lygus hesperus TaxID=30085 RepID=A0A0A9YGN5_LYGHE